MRSPMLCVWGACVYLLSGCGGSSSVDFFDGSNGARLASSAGSATTGTAGTSAQASTGGGSSGPGPGGAGSTSMNMGSSAPCGPAKDVTGGSSGPFGTASAECFRVSGAIVGWGCSNFDGRSVNVNGSDVTCGQLPLPDALDGAYYFDVSAGTLDYASFYWY